MDSQKQKIEDLLDNLFQTIEDDALPSKEEALEWLKNIQNTHALLCNSFELVEKIIASEHPFLAVGESAQTLREIVLRCIEQQIIRLFDKQSELIRLEKYFPREKDELLTKESCTSVENITKQIVNFIGLQQNTERERYMGNNHYGIDANRYFKQKSEQKLLNYPIEKLLKTSQALRLLPDFLTKECEKLEKFSPNRLSQELFKIVKKSSDIVALQSIYTNSRDSKDIKPFSIIVDSITFEILSTPLYTTQYYVDLIRKVCVIRALELIREQFRLPEDQLSSKIKALKLSPQKEKAFARFRAELSKGKYTYQFFPNAPFDLKLGNNTYYVDLCAILQNLPFLRNEFSAKDITNNQSWNECIQKLLDAPIENFSCAVNANDESDTTPLEPTHIQPLSHEDLAELDELIKANGPSSVCRQI